MSRSLIVFDLETVPDYSAIARIDGISPDNIEAAKASLGEAFPRPPCHKIVVIGYLIADYADKKWNISEIAAPSIEASSEKQLISHFLKLIDMKIPILVTFNGLSFDLPVLRYRAMMHRISSHALADQRYFDRFKDPRHGDAHIDLCDRLAGPDSRSRMKLDDLCKIFNIAGKTGGVDGSNVAAFVDAEKIHEVAAYCMGDVAATYRLFLLSEVFARRLDAEDLNRPGFAGGSNS